MKTIIIKGATLGIVAGLIVTLFDGLFMLLPNVYVPVSYPFLLFSFNVPFWMLVGSFSGLLLKASIGKRRDFREKENFFWVLFFVLPFTLIYGLLGRTFIPLFTTTVTSSTNVFDHHLSFVWASLVLLFSSTFKKRTIPATSLAISFMPEIVTIAALFTFCSNIAQLPIIYECIGYLFFQVSRLSDKDYLSISQWHFISLYSMGVLLILGFYLLTIFKVNFFNKRQNHMMVLLCSVVSISLAAFFTINHSRFVGANYPSIKQKELSDTGKKPSIILIVLDTVRADRLSIYGPQGITKSLESVAADSLVFENCIAPSPWTTPSHASLFTGLFPSEHGSVNALSKKKSGLRPTPLAEEFLALAEIFQDNSYKTGAVVSNSGALHKSLGINQGFQIYDATKNIGDIYRSYPFHPLVHLFCHVTNVYPKFIKPRRTADDVTKVTFRALEKLFPAPFFLFINYMDAHDPYRPPRPFDGYFLDTTFPQLYRLKQSFLRIINKVDDTAWNNYQLSQYDGEISFLDHQLGKLFFKLKALNLYDSSFIIITSDHGELFGEHGFNFHVTPMYEGVVKVPLIIKYPFNQKVGREKQMITLTDLYPTILSMCDLPIPENISGKIFGRGSSPIVSEFYNYGMGAHRILYDRQYKYMKYEYGRNPELYDLEKDPLEEVNLSEGLSAITADMDQQLDAWRAKHKPKSDMGDKTEPLPREVEDGLKALGYIN